MLMSPASKRKKENSFAPHMNFNLREAISAHQTGQLEKAEALYKKILAVNPTNFDALHLLGVVALQKGDWLDGVKLIGKAIAVDSRHVDAHINIGNAYWNLLQYDDALASFDRALQLSHDLPDVLNKRGIILSKLGQGEAALESYDRALRAQPAFPNALNNRGSLLASLGRFDEALVDFDRALECDPDYVDALNNRGNVLLSVTRYEEAVASYKRAIEISPGHVATLSNLANGLRLLNRLEEALAICDNALWIEPKNIGALVNRGTILRAANRHAEALASYSDALHLSPDHADAHLYQSLCRLSMGDFEQGWPQHEWRWKSRELNYVRQTYSQPLWNGASSLRGKTILLHAEQGLGDAIQFCRYVPMVVEQGATVLLAVPEALKSLMVALNGVTRVLTPGDALPHFDCHCPLLSLPMAFKTDLQTIPAQGPYLKPDAMRLAVWSAKLGEKTKPRIGIVWSGNKQHKNDHNRSIPVLEFIKLASEDVQLVSLQKEVTRNDRSVLETHANIICFGDELCDFSETAALIANMDLVISVDTSVAHLAGALGMQTWVLLPFSPDWRWLLDRTDSPWYRSLTLFRQPKLGDWSSVIAQLAQRLRHMVEK